MADLSISMLHTLKQLDGHAGFTRGRYGRSAHALERRGLLNRRYSMPEMVWEFRITAAGRAALQNAIETRLHPASPSDHGGV